MLFNSYEFVFLFLPLVLAGYYLCGRTWGNRAGFSFLILASLFFYAWWNVGYLWLLVALLAGNYAAGMLLLKLKGRARTLWFGLAIASNIACIGYYKYAFFLTQTYDALAGTEYSFGRDILLPLGISFFIFQKIAWLVDIYKGKTGKCGFLSFSLFVTFFPQLIAGPIVHYADVIPQFEKPDILKFSPERLANGLTIFIIGLFKKVVIADTLARFATPVFARADGGEIIGFWEGWSGTLAYGFQLYFDFSGYSDMAIGLALMFGITLPLNFFSPYKSESIIDFWRRWHMTLSRFFRDYVYIPLGGNRKGPVRRHVNLLATMLLCGLWHGAGWNFVLWGGLHGVLLVINHVWRIFFPLPTLPRTRGRARVGAVAAHLLTLACVMALWTFFRAETFGGAIAMLQGMILMHGAGALPALKLIVLLAGAYAVCVLLPNPYQFMEMIEKYKNLPVLKYRDALGAAAVCAMFVMVLGRMGAYSEFLYFQF